MYLLCNNMLTPLPVRTACSGWAFYFYIPMVTETNKIPYPKHLISFTDQITSLNKEKWFSMMNQRDITIVAVHNNFCNFFSCHYKSCFEHKDTGRISCGKYVVYRMLTIYGEMLKDTKNQLIRNTLCMN